MTDQGLQSTIAVHSEHRGADMRHLKRCHRSDGKGWQCSHEAKHGFNYCEHHQVYMSRLDRKSVV